MTLWIVAIAQASFQDYREPEIFWSLGGYFSLTHQKQVQIDDPDRRRR